MTVTEGLNGCVLKLNLYQNNLENVIYSVFYLIILWLLRQKSWEVFLHIEKQFKKKTRLIIYLLLYGGGEGADYTHDHTQVFY